MDPFAGFEPAVGEIRALRTFRLGPGGALFPLFGSWAWTDGANRAVCGNQAGRDHDAPHPDCTCGFYAYGSVAATADYPQSKYVLAVVSCWGHVIAGTRGLRSAYGRIEGLWLASDVPDELAEQAADRYRSARLYRDRERMLTDFPLTDLDCYEPVAPNTPTHRWFWLLTTVAIVIGTLPSTWLNATLVGRSTWLVLLGLFLLGGLAFRARDAGSARRRIVCLSVVLWLLAPFMGTGGWFFLRLPVIQTVGLAAWHRLQSERSARRFPALIE